MSDPVIQFIYLNVSPHQDKFDVPRRKKNNKKKKKKKKKKVSCGVRPHFVTPPVYKMRCSNALQSQCILFKK